MLCQYILQAICLAGLYLGPAQLSTDDVKRENLELTLLHTPKSLYISPDRIKQFSLISHAVSYC